MGEKLSYKLKAVFSLTAIESELVTQLKFFA